MNTKGESEGINNMWKVIVANFAVVGLLGLVCSSLLLSGCRRPRRLVQQPVVRVCGTILFKGKPTTGAVVCFHPIGVPRHKALPSSGRVGQDGIFSLTTYAKADGAPEGEYVVTVYWGGNNKTHQNGSEDTDKEDDLPPDQLGGRFVAQERSVLRAKVGDKPIEFAPVDLGSEEVLKSHEYRLHEK